MPRSSQAATGYLNLNQQSDKLGATSKILCPGELFLECDDVALRVGMRGIDTSTFGLIYASFILHHCCRWRRFARQY